MHVVHGWNRSPDKAAALKDVSNVQIHTSAADAVAAASNLVIMNVVGDKRLATAEKIIKSVPLEAWKGKTLVQWSSHQPYSAKVTHLRLAQTQIIEQFVPAAPEKTEL